MLASVRIGEGPRTTILLHGFLGSGRNLVSLARRWSELDPTQTFLLPDLTGHGGSPPVRPDDDLGSLARDVLATVRAEGLPLPCSFTGHSLGGRVALAAVLEEPEAVRDVTLLDIGPSPIPEATSESGQILAHLRRAPATAQDRGTVRRFLLGAGISAPIVEWLLMNLVHAGDGYAWRIDREALAALHVRVNRQDLWRALPLARVRCVRGERSRYVTEQEKARLEAAGCPVATLAGAGHFVHVDAPGPLLDLLTGRAAFPSLPA